MWFLRSLDAYERVGRWLITSPAGCDDLHRRVEAFVFGLLFSCLGPFFLIGSLMYGEQFPGWFLASILLFGIVFTVQGTALLLRCILPARSPIVRFADKHFAMGGGETVTEGIQIYIILLLVIQLLTRLLRLLGAKGERDNGTAAGERPDTESGAAADNSAGTARPASSSPARPPAAPTGAMFAGRTSLRDRDHRNYGDRNYGDSA
jgi:hypothetical protein